MKFLVWSPDETYQQGPEDGRVIEASCAQYAAQEWAEHRDFKSSDYLIVGGTPAEVVVRNIESGHEATFVVSGESVPQYHARLRIANPEEYRG